MAAKGEKLAKRALYGEVRKHHCPICPLDAETGDLVPMSAIMVMPGRRIEFRCPNGHVSRKKDTILL